MLGQWLLGRSDTAKDRREKEIRAIAEKAITDAAEKMNVNVRLNTIETLLPIIKSEVSEVKELVMSTNETLNNLARDGRLPIRRTDPKY